MPRVLVTRTLEAGAWQAFQACGWDLELLEAPSAQQLVAAAKHCHGLVSMLTDRLDAAFFAAIQGSPLQIIAQHAVGVDNIDLAAARAAGIQVTNTPDVLTHATAEFALTLLLNLLRRVREGEILLRSGQWQGWEPTQLLGSSLRGKKVGVLGAGRIGQAFAGLAHALGAELAYYSRSRKPALESSTGARWMNFKELLAWSEVLSLHLPGGPETHHLLNAETLSYLPRGAMLINTGRGNSIDQQALIQALASGHLGGVALDVYEHEPHIPAELLAFPQALLLPHLGSATVETRRAMALTCLRNLQAVFAGQPPLNPVV